MLPPLNLHVDDVFTTSVELDEEMLAGAFKKAVRELVCPQSAHKFNLLGGIEPFILDVIYTQLQDKKTPTPENIEELRKSYRNTNLSKISVEVGTEQVKDDTMGLAVKINVAKVFMNSIIEEYLHEKTSKITTQAMKAVIGKAFTGNNVTIEIYITDPFDPEKLRATLLPNTALWANLALKTVNVLFKAKTRWRNWLSYPDDKKQLWGGLSLDDILTLVINDACYGGNLRSNILYDMKHGAPKRDTDGA
jgi:hypothetical protein